MKSLECSGDSVGIQWTACIGEWVIGDRVIWWWLEIRELVIDLAWPIRAAREPETPLIGSRL